MYRKLLFACLLFAGIQARSQVVKVDLQASGLTCSMCSNAINKALRSLDFVEKVDADIRNSSFTVRFKPGAEADFDKMKDKVEGAGFFVAKFLVTLRFEPRRTLDDHCIFVGSTLYQVTNLKEQYLEGEKTIRIMDKGFLSAKEFKKNAASASGACYKRLDQEEKKFYHVILN